MTEEIPPDDINSFVDDPQEQEQEEKEEEVLKTPRLTTILDYTFSHVLGYNARTNIGKSLRFWAKYYKFESLHQLMLYDVDSFKIDGALEQYKEDSSSFGTTTLAATPLMQLYHLRRYVEHIIHNAPSDIPIFSPEHPLSLEQWKDQDNESFMNFVVSQRASPATSMAAKAPPTSTTAQDIVTFKKGIKRESTAYPTLQDERKFDVFSRSFQIVAKAHEVEDVLDPDYVPTPAEAPLFKLKQTFVYSVLNTHLLTDMGKTLVRKHYHDNDAQAVWKELQEHMKSSSKGASEKRRLTQYVTNTVLDDNFKGTTEQFVLHFNEQFRQLDEISDPPEQFSPNVKMILLQNAVRGISELSNIETLDEFLSITTSATKSSHLKYQSYYELLINACVRYDKTKKANVAKKSNVYATIVQDSGDDVISIPDSSSTIYDGIDTPSEDFIQINSTRGNFRPNQFRGKPKLPPQSSRPSRTPFLPSNPSQQASTPSVPQKKYEGPVYLPSHIFNMLGREAKDALVKYNTDAVKKWKSRQVNEMDESIIDNGESPPLDSDHISVSDEPDLQIQSTEVQPESDLLPPDLLDLINTQNDHDEQLQSVIQAYKSTSSRQPAKRKINVHMTYHITQAQKAQHGSLVDRGANGGLAGSDVRILTKSMRKCTVTGIDNHALQGLDIVQAAALVNTNHGPVNLILNEYAYYGHGHTIHSSGQIEYFKNEVDDKSFILGGKQCITTVDGYSMPLICKGGLMYLSFMGKPTNDDLAKYPSVHLTSPHEWDPSVLDYEHSEDDPTWLTNPNDRFMFDPKFDEFGDYNNRVILALDYLADIPSPQVMSLSLNLHNRVPDKPNYEKLRPYFGWVNADVVKNTMDQTTQWGVSVDTIPMKRHLKSRNPALNVPRRHEPVATDTIMSDTPAVDSGVTNAQLFVGRDSLVADVYPIKSTKQFVNTLEDNIRYRGAMDTLLSDSAKVEISKKVMDVLRAYHISNWTSEPYHQNQNPAEWRYRTIKAWTNNVMNRTGAPANCWLLCIMYVCYLLNHIACSALNGSIPLLVLSGITPDISILLLYTFYQPVYYATHNQSFPSQSEERAAYWVGFGEHCGDAMTHKLLDKESQKIIYRSAVRPKLPDTPNKRLALDGGELPTSSPPKNIKDTPVFVKSRQDADPSTCKPMPTFDPKDLIGRIFLMPPEQNGDRYRAKVTQQVIEKIEKENGNRVEQINFILDIGEGKTQELITYNELVDFLEQAEEEESSLDSDTFHFREIIGHEGPLNPNSPNWQGHKWNVQVHWETGEITYVPLTAVSSVDPVSCAVYAKKHNLLDTPGWKQFKRYAKTHQRLVRSIRQSKLRQVRRSNKYMFGYLIPKNYQEALQFDKENGNTKWEDLLKKKWMPSTHIKSLL